MLTRLVMIPVTAIAVGAMVGPVQAQQEMARTVADGGIHADGWMGTLDANEIEAGQTLESARLAMEGDVLHATTGPAVVYWNPANVASGDYTVSATFMEPEYMNLNNHPHPYGIAIGGSGLDGDQARYLYCAAYGNGNFIVRGFGPEPFQVNGRRGETSDAVHVAAGPGEAVSQEIAVSVVGDMVECAINGTVVGSYPKADIVGEGRLASTDGIYGIRFGHNTEALVSDLTHTSR